MSASTRYPRSDSVRDLGGRAVVARDHDLDHSSAMNDCGRDCHDTD